MEAQFKPLSPVFGLPAVGVPPISARVVYSADGSLAVAGTDSTLHVWNPLTGQPIEGFDGSQDCADADFVSISFDGRLVATSDWQNNLNIYSTKTGEQVSQCVHAQVLSSLAFSPDSNRIASGCLDGVFRIWQSRTGRL